MQQPTHALVIGGSLSGLLAARALVPHFERVTLIERDFYPDQPSPRKGLPQSRFPHSLMMRGQQILETLFPGLRAELLAQGAVEMDAGAEIAYLTPFGWAPRSPSGLRLLACSRDLLDWAVRRRLVALPNVQVLEGATVVKLLASADCARVTGVLVKRRDRQAVEDLEKLSTSHEEALTADLVIDASGKGSRAPQWLQALGYEPPKETEVNAFLGYTARIYARPTQVPVDWTLLMMQTAPPQQHRGGAIFPIEGDRWIVSLAGGDRDYPPIDEAGFLEFARQLPSSVLYDAIKEAKPLSDIYDYRGNENRLRHYDQLSRQPGNFVVIGHAACAFNPTYGQGMTVAALTAEILEQFFQKHPINQLSNQTRKLQKHLAKAHQDAWLFAVGQDARFRSATAQRPAPIMLWINRYLDELGKVSLEQREVQQTLMEVMQMLKPASVLFGPQMLKAVLKHQWQQLVGQMKPRGQHWQITENR